MAGPSVPAATIPCPVCVLARPGVLACPVCDDAGETTEAAVRAWEAAGGWVPGKFQPMPGDVVVPRRDETGKTAATNFLAALGLDLATLPATCVCFEAYGVSRSLQDASGAITCVDCGLPVGRVGVTAAAQRPVRAVKLADGGES